MICKHNSRWLSALKRIEIRAKIVRPKLLYNCFNWCRSRWELSVAVFYAGHYFYYYELGKQKGAIKKCLSINIPIISGNASGKQQSGQLSEEENWRSVFKLIT